MFFMFKHIKVFLIFLLIKSNIFGQTVTRGPYLQQVTSSSIVIRWSTDLATNSHVHISVGTPNFKSIVDDLITKEHILKISNLQPETKYDYSIINKNLVLKESPNQYFQTAPTSDSKRPIHIWAGGDFADISNQIYLTNQTQVRDSYLAYSKQFNTDLWLWLGDVGYGGDRDNTLQKNLFNFYGPQIMNHVPFAATLGNHEFDEDPVNQQKTRDVNLLKITSPATNGEAGGLASGTKAYYSFDYGNTHFINLDSYGMDEGIYRLYDTKSPQYQWLIKDLEANKSMWTIVFFHHPPYTKRAHDSDTEEELRLLRQTLVPVFDKYKVDLVLNGHSHIYERSYLMQDFLGTSQFFDPSYMIVNKNSGKYQKNESPIINKTIGTTYIVAGTFGRLEPILALRLNDPAHPSSYYSNLITGGSLTLKIEDNRLDCEWLCADGVVRDRFTMFKNVSKTTKLNLGYGQNTRLKASWPGSYVWSNGVKNNAEIEVAPFQNTIYSVKDSLGYLEDKFEINVAPQPIIEPNLPQNLIVCVGRTIVGLAQVSNTDFETWKYTIELSDQNGNFTNPLVSQPMNDKQFSFVVPKTAPEGNGYKIRILPNSNLFQVKESPNFKMNIPAEVGFANEPTIQFQSDITLNLNFKGTFPIEFLVSFDNKSQITNQEKLSFNLKPIRAETYEILSVKNVCNEGEIINKKVILLAPLSVELEQLGVKMYPVPTESKLTIELLNSAEYEVVISNSNGKLIKSKNIKQGKNIIFLDELPSGMYQITLKANGKYFVSKFLKN